MRVPGATLRRLIPAAAVAAVLAASLMVPVSTLASSTNNCGVKGYGYHDHGKVCPNRPFPGKGVGLAKFGILSVHEIGNGKVAKSITSLEIRAAATAATSTSVKTNTRGSDAKLAHSHGNGRGLSRGHQAAD